MNEVEPTELQPPLPDVVLNEPRFQQILREGSAGLWALNGIGWMQAPAPRRWHRHWAQTVGQIGYFEEVWRCPCGAQRQPDGPWVLLDRKRTKGGW